MRLVAHRDEHVAVERAEDLEASGILQPRDFTCVDAPEASQEPHVGTRAQAEGSTYLEPRDGHGDRMGAAPGSAGAMCPVT